MEPTKKKKYKLKPIIKITSDQLSVWALVVDLGILVAVLISIGLQVADMALKH